MIISKSNFASEATVTITPESATQDISVIVDGDFSSTYQDALQTEATITLNFGQLRDIGYLAIVSNATTKDSITISSNTYTVLTDSQSDEITDSNGEQIEVLSYGGIDDSTLGLMESRVLMYRLPDVQISNISITIRGTGQLKVTEIACGEIYEVPNHGEQGGYNRPWGVPNIKNRSAINLQSAPVNHSYEARSLSSTLQVNYLKNIENTEWDEFLQFATLNTFYILEDDNKYHSYACFNGEPTMPKADSRTRELNAVAIKFNAYARENEVIF